MQWLSFIGSCGQLQKKKERAAEREEMLLIKPLSIFSRSISTNDRWDNCLWRILKPLQPLPLRLSPLVSFRMHKIARILFHPFTTTRQSISNHRRLLSFVVKREGEKQQQNRCLKFISTRSLFNGFFFICNLLRHPFINIVDDRCSMFINLTFFSHTQIERASEGAWRRR